MHRYIFFFPILIFFHVSANSSDTISLMGRIDNSAEPQKIISSGMYVSSDTFGMRANAVGLAVRANPDAPYIYPVNGFSYTKALSSYGNRDSVGLYADNSSLPLNEWQVIRSAIYTPTSFSSPDIDLSKIKPGMLLDTDTNPKWSAYVISVNNRKVTTAGWVNNKTKKMGTPPQNSNLIISPITKIWATNFNIFFKPDGNAKAGVIQENGLVNNLVNNPIAINGIDTVVLSNSKYDGTAAYLARAATGGMQRQWRVGFISQGARNANFDSAESTSGKSPKYGFLESSKADVGLQFNGENKESSIQWGSEGKILTKFSPDGQFEKIAYKTKVLDSSQELTDRYARYILKNEKPITLTLPKSTIVNDGFTIEVVEFLNTKVSFNADVAINELSSNNRIKVITYVDHGWYIY